MEFWTLPLAKERREGGGGWARTGRTAPGPGTGSRRSGHRPGRLPSLARSQVHELRAAALVHLLGQVGTRDLLLAPSRVTAQPRRPVCDICTNEDNLLDASACTEVPAKGFSLPCSAGADDILTHCGMTPWGKGAVAETRPERPHLASRRKPAKTSRRKSHAGQT